MPFRLCFFALICLGLASCGSLRDSKDGWDSDPKMSAELTAINAKLTEAYLNEDVPTLRRMLSDNHVHNNVFGMPLDKETFLKDIESGVLKFTAYDTPKLRWFIEDDVAIATGLIEAKAERGGKPVPASTFLFTRIFVKDGGQWKVLLFHNTMAGKPPGS